MSTASTASTARTFVLVEGESDLIALQALAGRLGRDLAAEGTRIVAMSGITNTRTVALRHGPMGDGGRLAGLYDAPEERRVRGGLAQAGIAQALTGDCWSRRSIPPRRSARSPHCSRTSRRSRSVASRRPGVEGRVR